MYPPLIILVSSALTY